MPCGLGLGDFVGLQKHENEVFLCCDTNNSIVEKTFRRIAHFAGWDNVQMPINSGYLSD